MPLKYDYGAVYQILDIMTGARYVGSTTTTRKRWYEHRWALRRNEHANHALQAAWNKDGESAFRFQTLEMHADSAILLEREKNILEKTAARGTVYNITMCASFSTEARRSPQGRRKNQLGAQRQFSSPESRQRHGGITREAMDNPELRARLSHSARNRKTKGKVWRKYDITLPDGGTVRVGNLKGFAQENNLSYDCLLRCRELNYEYQGYRITQVAKS